MDDDGVSTDRFRFCAFLWDDILLYIDGLLDGASLRGHQKTLSFF